MVGVVGVVGGVGVVGVVGFVPVVARARLSWSELLSLARQLVFASVWARRIDLLLVVVSWWVRGLFVFVRSTVQWTCSMVCERMKDRVRVRATRTIFPPFYMVT